ncbi:hypothetical protein QVD17_08579 [Tagetes erecta]|uniref:Uncharacterized protein n=1 Tax=Tagetes erecta TaxID=13708 RepID=A0AAD8NXN7_TARER|nr:hypothetical protein QVD17_08579 [Tagetes erecta]
MVSGSSRAFGFGFGADVTTALFERVANRARGIRSEVKQLAESVQRQEEEQEDIRELEHLFEAAKAELIQKTRQVLIHQHMFHVE